MNREQFDDKQYHLSVTAGMNQRYHQQRNHVWACWNRAVQITVAALAVLGVCLALAAWLGDDERIDIAAVAVGGLAAVAAIALNVVPLGDWSQQHADLFRRWTDLREDIDALEFDAEGEISAELRERLKQLDAKVHRICGSEPQFNQALLDKCFADEERSRRTATPSPPKRQPVSA